MQYNIELIGGKSMIQFTPDSLYHQLEEACNMRKTIVSANDNLALSNYIGNLYRALICMGDSSIDLSRHQIFGGKGKYRTAIKKLNIYSDRMLENYVLNQSFHKQFLQDVIPDIEDEMMWFCPLTFPKEDEFSKDDFFDILYQFMRQFGVDELFDYFYKNGHIYSSQIGQTDHNIGFIIYNPINHDTDIFIRNLGYNFTSLNTVVHEFGHGYDLNQLHGNSEEYNHYYYTSFYGEVFSRLFERLFFHYCIENNIRGDTVRDHLIDFEDLNHGFLLGAYIFSLLDPDFLLNDDYLDCEVDTIVKKVKNYFTKNADIAGVLESLSEFDFAEIYSYAYGDILSLFLSEDALKNGLQGEEIRSFLEHRTSVFQKEFLEEHGYSSERYAELYRKEVQLIKK